MRKDNLIKIAVGAGVIIVTLGLFAYIKTHERSVSRNFSAIGVISSVSSEAMIIEKASGSDGKRDTSYAFSMNSVLKVETNKYKPVNMSELKAGDKVIVQGSGDPGKVFVTRIVLFRK